MLQPALPGIPLPNICKDLHSALELADALSLQLPIGALAAQVADTGIAIGHDNPKI